MVNSHKLGKRRLIMALQCFIDESADGSGNHTVVMAGYVACDRTWQNFNKDWNNELANQNREFAHFSNKIYNGRKATKNAEKFYRVIEQHLDKAFCVVCSVPEYRALLKKVKFPNSLKESPRYGLLKEPNFFLYRAFIDFCFDEKKRLGIDEPVSLIFDESNRYNGIIAGTFEYFYHSAEKMGLNVSDFGEKPIFLDDEKTPALQAADLLARLVRTSTVSGDFNVLEDSEIKMPWKKIKPIKHLVTQMSENYILTILDSSFSKENLKIYEEYTKARHYRFYDFLNRFLKCLPAFVRVPIFRVLNKPLLLG